MMARPLRSRGEQMEIIPLQMLQQELGGSLNLNGGILMSSFFLPCLPSQHRIIKSRETITEN